MKARPLFATQLVSLSIVVLANQNCGQMQSQKWTNDVHTSTDNSSSSNPPSTTTTTQEPMTITEPIATGTPVTTLATGHGFTEGPVWVPALNSLLLSDQSDRRIYQINLATLAKTIFRDNTSTANGNIIAADGRLLTCESSPLRRIAITDLVTKVTTTLVNTYNNQPLNAPNDMALFKDGSVFFTDPTYGTNTGDLRQPVRGIYRVKSNGEITLFASDLVQPNGVVFSPDYKILYASDTDRQIIMKYTVDEGGNKLTAEIFTTLKVIAGASGYDGLAMDSVGNLYTGGNRAVNIYNPQGQLIQSFMIGENTTNLKFGTTDKKTLFVVSPTTVRSVRVLIPGI